MSRGKSLQLIAVHVSIVPEQSDSETDKEYYGATGKWFGAYDLPGGGVAVLVEFSQPRFTEADGWHSAAWFHEKQIRLLQ